MISSDPPQRTFDPPQEAEWHRMIAEAAYYLAQKRGFRGEHSLEDWLAAEREVRQVISPDSTPQNRPAPDANALKPGGKAGGAFGKRGTPGKSNRK
jgi:hypothetical protein